MKLGTSVELRARVADRAAAQAFYTALGFQPVTDHVLTDGAVNLALVAADSPDVHLAYYGADLDALRAAGLPLEDAPGGAVLTDPYGRRVLLLAEPGSAPMPPGEPIARTPLSRLGKMGEYSMSVGSFADAAAFWGQCGFDQLYTATEPYPWGIVTDGLIVVGLHEHVAQPHITHDPRTVPPALTYFAADMPDRLKTFKDEGIEILPVSAIGEPDDTGQNARIVGPGAITIYLFTGDL